MLWHQDQVFGDFLHWNDTNLFFKNWNILSQMPYWGKKNTDLLLKLYWNQNNNYRINETCRKQSPKSAPPKHCVRQRNHLCKSKQSKWRAIVALFLHILWYCSSIACSFLVFLCKFRFMSWIHTLIPLISMSKHNLKTSTPIEVHFGEKTHLQHAFH
jgi:hypothetical protein